MMPDPRGNAQPQFPPPGFQGQAAQVLDPSAPGYNEQPRPVQYAHEAPPTETVTEEFGDYWGVDIRHRYEFPDGKQYIEFKVLSEGDLAQYQKLLKRDIRVEKATGDAHIRVDQVEERHALLQTAITGWYIVRKNLAGQYVPVTFSRGSAGSELSKWINSANPQFVAEVADAIREKNPFLLGTDNETLEAIEQQIEDLYRKRELILRRTEGNDGSRSS